MLGHIRYALDSMWCSILVLDGGSCKLCLYSRQGFEQLLMSTVVQSDLLTRCFELEVIVLKTESPLLFWKCLAKLNQRSNYEGLKHDKLCAWDTVS